MSDSGVDLLKHTLSTIFNTSLEMSHSSDEADNDLHTNPEMAFCQVNNNFILQYYYSHRHLYLQELPLQNFCQLYHYTKNSISIPEFIRTLQENPFTIPSVDIVLGTLCLLFAVVGIVGNAAAGWYLVTDLTSLHLNPRLKTCNVQISDINVPSSSIFLKDLEMPNIRI